MPYQHNIETGVQCEQINTTSWVRHARQWLKGIALVSGATALGGLMYSALGTLAEENDVQTLNSIRRPARQQGRQNGGPRAEGELQVEGRDTEVPSAISEPLTTESAHLSRRTAPMVVNPIPDQTASFGQLFRLKLNASQIFYDSDGDKLTLTATLADGSPLPSWLNFAGDYSTTGTPTFLGNYDTPGYAMGVHVIGSTAMWLIAIVVYKLSM